MHCHKSITGIPDTVKTAKRFAFAKELRKGHFGKFERGCALGVVYDKPPHPPRFKTLCRLNLVPRVFSLFKMAAAREKTVVPK